jgi:serine/threonine protein kinase
MGIIGQGTYGKVYRPPLPCKKNNATKSNRVGKVFDDRENFDKEVRLMKKVKKLDIKNTFSIQMYETCKENLEIIYADGGQDLYDYIGEHDGRKEFMIILKHMEHICKGIKLLLEHDLVHQDIKLENIVYNNKAIYLIDFGLMVKRSEIFKNSTFLEYDYLAFPPEYKLAAFGADRFREFFHVPKIIKAYYKDWKSDLETLASLKSTEYKKTDKIDIYSLGMVIAQLYKWSMKRDKAIENLICGMISFNPKKRWDIDHVIDWFTSQL